MSETEAAAPPGRTPDRREVVGLFDWLAPRYDAAVVAYTLGQDLRWKHRLVADLAPRRGERALDLATGTGLLYDRLAGFLGADHVVGLDLNRAMLLHSRPARAPRRLVHADALHLPFPDRSFDLVCAGYLLKYVPLAGFFAEVRRVLRPGGRFGGYDFSAPLRGTLGGRGYRIYLSRILPAAARLRHPADGAWEELFRFLERVASSSGWEEEAAREARSAGFAAIRLVPSLGGAVTWCWASGNRA